MELKIENLIHDHAALRGHMQLLRQSVDKWRTLLSPQELDNPAQAQVLTEKRGSFIQALSYLKEGLAGLQDHEEAVMAGVADSLSLRTVRAVHTEIMQRIAQINKLVINLDLNLLRINGDILTDAINNLCDLVTEHTLSEDRLLQSLDKRSQRVLQTV
jgi:hypothetical protein